ncbi:hypothetical protein PR003_g6044 [Phytophthora rubi]|uniref:RxLR effector protein n=1 Tax=Phytophthora rubi TaxID=129364 RepID=A0A6A3NB89_9STRA|nr:hypothetical protein PR002_g5820 [Phytophthora rubi]KAE9044152.1 hypothetical protein PR001_g5493 [Phytophthora rubi]KAE9349165.1 hypothetical protein PR003_g6044 [Phytophthora rubi]
MSVAVLVLYDLILSWTGCRAAGWRTRQRHLRREEKDCRPHETDRRCRLPTL